MTALILQQIPWRGSRPVEFAALGGLVAMTSVVAYHTARKFLKVRKAVRASRSYALTVARPLSHLNWREAIAVSERYKESHLAAMILAALQCRERNMKLPPELLLKFMAQEMQSEVLTSHYREKEYSRVIEAIGASAPVVGAIGGSTVTLVYAVLLAIPAIWSGFYFRRMNERFETEEKNTANEFLLFFERSMTPIEGTLDVKSSG